MLIGGRKTLHYSDTLLIRIDPGLRAALAAAAQREGKPMSEIVRQNVRAALTGSALTVPGGGDAHAQTPH